jgi:hypothetical protein
MVRLRGISIWVGICLGGCSNSVPGGMTLGVDPGAGNPPAAGTVSAVAGTSAPPTSTGSAGTAAIGGSPASAAAGRGATGSGSAGTGTTGAGSAASGMVGGMSGTSGTVATAGSGAAGNGNAGMSGGGSGGSGGTSTFKRPCVSAGKEVVFIGDSYSDYDTAHTKLSILMEQLATQDGALMAGDHYVTKALAGTTIAAPPANIPMQWDDAKTMKPIKVVVMDGGGNDVLINNTQCRADGAESMPDCQQVVKASLDATKMLWTSMKDSGVSDVLMFWYPHIPGGLLTGFETGNTISDYAYPMLEAAAKAATTDTFHVYMVPTVSIFEGHPEYFYSDGLHANTTGEGKIADAIWAVMKQNCIGQGVSSGCCMP